MSDPRPPADFSLEHPRLAERLEQIDARCQLGYNVIASLVAATAAATENELVRRLANEARAVARTMRNDINGFAEELGCNYRSRPDDAALHAVPASAE